MVPVAGDRESRVFRSADRSYRCECLAGARDHRRYPDCGCRNVGLPPVLCAVGGGIWAAPADPRRASRRISRSDRGGVGFRLTFLLALAYVGTVESGMALLFRFVEFPRDAFRAAYAMILSQDPFWAWVIIVTSSATAGICEEIGFCGYMQPPIESRHGPIYAIAITSAVLSSSILRNHGPCRR